MYILHLNNTLAFTHIIMYTLLQYMKKIFSRFLSISSLGFLSVCIPSIVFAQSGSVNDGFEKVGGLIDSFTTNIVQALVTLMLGLAVVSFFYGIVQYIWGLREGNAEKAKTGSSFMVWGLIALFVMFSVWGIIAYAQDLFKIQALRTLTAPSVIIGGSGQAGASGLPNGSAGLPSGSTIRAGGGQTGGGSSACNGITSETQRNACLNAQGGGGGATGSTGGSYSCSPGYECTLPGGGIGLCNNAGACVSNASPNNVCLAYGDGTGCTDANGLTGVCISGVCTPNNSN